LANANARSKNLVREHAQGAYLGRLQLFQQRDEYIPDIFQVAFGIF
jgi:hypothetical protein